MKLLYVEEHLNCYMYDTQKDSIIRYLEKEKGEKISFKNAHSQLFFLLKGKIKYNSEYYVNQVFKAGTFLLLPHESSCAIEVKEKLKLVVVKMHQEVNFCNHFPLTMLSEFNLNRKKTNDDSLLYLLKTNDVIDDWLKSVVKSISTGLKCSYFQELKQKEILYYLRAFYSKEDLFAFFSPILNGDVAFSNLIYQHHKLVKNINELAKITSYSLSGFKRKFGKVFGVPPAVWIKREKAKKIFHEINCTVKPFKEIAVEYDFSSSAHFDKFCKKMYNMSPGTLRENTKNRVLNIETKH